MGGNNATKSYQVLRSHRGGSQRDSLELIGEEPLVIRVEDKPYSVVMRTPGEEVYHAAGFCLGEGIADAPDEIRNIGYDEKLDPNLSVEDLKKVLRDIEKVTPPASSFIISAKMQKLRQNIVSAEKELRHAIDAREALESEAEKEPVQKTQTFHGPAR